MRAVWTVIASGSLGVALVGATASTAQAESPLEVIRWDTSTCATEGAASPVVMYSGHNPGPYSIVRALGIDDQDYSTVRVGPGADSVTETLPPVRAGDHTLYELSRDGSTRSGQIQITAPACPDGSPEPSDRVHPRPSAAPADLRASWQDPTCGGGEHAADVAVLPFDWANDGEGAGTMQVLVDGQVLGESEISPGAAGTQYVDMGGASAPTSSVAPARSSST